MCMLISDKGQVRFIERILVIFLIILFVFALYNITENSINTLIEGYFLLKSRQYLNLFDFYISVLKRENVISGEICILKDKDIEIIFHNNTITFKNNKYIRTYRWKHNLIGICSKNKRICIKKESGTLRTYCKSIL